MSADSIKLIFLASLLLFTQAMFGCEQKNPASQYGDSLISAYEQGKKGGEEAHLKNIRDAIQAYHAANGKYPQTTKEIENIMGSQVNFDLYQYNPETGEIKLKK